jgi:hypothetical protein
VYLKVPVEGEHTLRLVFEAVAHDPTGLVPSAFPSVPEVAPVNASARFWGGTVRSNDVRLRVLP